MADRDEHGSAIMGFVYIAMALLCAMASAYSVFHGLESLGALLSAFLSVIVFFSLFGFHLIILRTRRGGGRILGALLGPVLALLAVTVLSTSSSFTYFYSLFMRDRLALVTAQDARETFQHNVAHAETALLATGGTQEVLAQVRSELVNLRDQVRDPGNPGFGPEALEHRRHIYTLLASIGHRPTEIRYPPAPGDATSNNASLAEHQRVITAKIEEASQTDPISQALGAISTLRERALPDLDRIAASGPEMSFAELKAFVARTEEWTADAETEVTAALARAHVATSFNIEPVPSSGMDLFNIARVYEAVFREGRAVGVAVLSMFIGALLDLLPLFMALAMLPVERQSYGGSSTRAQDPTSSRAVRPSKGKVGLTSTTRKLSKRSDTQA